MRRILISIGTRPELIKLAPVIHALRARQEAHEARVVFTAQHRELLDTAAKIFGVRPDHDLDVMVPDQGLSALTARLTSRLGALIEEERPDLIVGQGDTTSALCTALAAYYAGVPFAHVEAGLRSGDLSRPWPEEGNRRAIGALARWHFAPTAQARLNLLQEGVAVERVILTGNTVIDALEHVAEHPDTRLPAGLDVDGPLVLITLHRREIHGAPLLGILRALRVLARLHPEVTFVFPVHPNPQVLAPARRALSDIANVRLLPPLPYTEFVGLMRCAQLVLTDSGGVQEEAPALGVPLLVLRDVTERAEGVEAGAAQLVGTDPEKIVSAAHILLSNRRAADAMRAAPNPYGDGRAAARIAEVLLTDRCARPFLPPTRSALRPIVYAS